jgi:hypothetical protein
MKDYLTLAETSEIIGKSKETLRSWDKVGILNAVREPVSYYRVYRKSDVQTLLGSLFDEIIEDDVSNYVEPENEYSVLELFAGAGGFSEGFLQAEYNNKDKNWEIVVSYLVENVNKPIKSFAPLATEFKYHRIYKTVKINDAGEVIGFYMYNKE